MSARSRDRADGERYPGGLDWNRDGREWPNRDSSRFVEAAGLTWHVQVAGQGPVVLLVHGTGASTHSWRDLLPALVRDFTVVAPDLPGHAFSAMADRRGMSLPGMAMGIADLLRGLDLKPDLAVGHSAGAAILTRLCLDHEIAPAGLVSLNGAMLPIGGLAGQIFSPLAGLLATTPMASRLFAWRAGDRAVVERLIRQTGSTIDAVGMDFYARLARDPGHATGALAMMAAWDLHLLERSLPQLKVPLLLVVGGHDRTIDPADAIRIRDLVPGARIDYLRGLGHLAHEEKPQQIAELIRAQATAWAV